MPELTRRRSPDAAEECWHVYYGDVCVGHDRAPIWQSNRHQRKSALQGALQTEQIAM